MIDTLQLYVQHGEFSVSDRHKVTVQPASMIQGESGELEPENEWPLFNNVMGAYAKHEGDRFNVNINANGLLVNYSVPKLLTGSNVYSVGHGGLVSSLSIISERLHGVGIETDILKASISRIDCFRNIETDRSFIDYVPVFRHAHAKRQQLREYGTTFLWYNRQWQACVYDKWRQETDAGRDMPAGIKGNLIRIEIRDLNGKKVRSSLPVGKAVDLLDRDRYNRVKLAYARRVTSVLFRQPPENLNDITTADIESGIDMGDTEREMFENLFAMTFEQVGGTEEKLREGLRQSFKKRYPNENTVNVKVNRFMKRYREARHKVFFSETKNRDLYTELYDKFKAAV